MNVYAKAKANARRGRECAYAVRSPATGKARHETDTEHHLPRTEGHRSDTENLRALWASLIVFVTLLLLPGLSYAQPVIEVSGNFAGYDDGTEYKGYIVCDSPNEYTSSLVLIGEYSSLIQIDSTMYAKLSSADKGGAFYRLTQKWEHIGTNKSGTSSNYPTWAGFGYYIDGLNAVYGYERNWECVVSTKEVEDALRDFHKILDGGSAGDDDEPSSPEDLPTDGTSYYLKWTEVINEAGTNGIVGVALPVSPYESLTSGLDDNGFGLYIAINQTDSTSAGKVMITTNTKPNLSNGVVSATNYTYFYYSSVNSKVYNGERYLTINLANSTINTMVNGSVKTEEKIDSNHNYVAYYWSMDETSGGGDGGDDTPIVPVDPPTDPLPTQPSPTAPNPPQLPNPSDPPVVYPSTPSQPDPPDWPQPSIVVPPGERYIEVPSNTSNQDYTPWLRAILLQLQALCEYFGLFADFLADELENHCIHIRDHMTQTIGWLGEYLADYLYDCFASLSDDLDLEFNNLKSYLKVLLNQHHNYLDNLAQWLVDNINWNAGGGEYDDSNLLYWIRRIWARQGTGTVNTRPVDPATDYSGFSAWFGMLSDGLALDLTSTNLSALTASITQLSGTFPFSLPWDVQRVISALSVNPQTPEATISIPDTDFFDGYDYDVDLHWLDGAMVSVRTIEMLAFCLYVLVHTRDLFYFVIGAGD